jgi:hypothetical protein
MPSHTPDARDGELDQFDRAILAVLVADDLALAGDCFTPRNVLSFFVH